jgi:hypothetical protein
VDDLLALLELALGALDEAHGGAHGVVVAGPREGPAELGDLVGRAVDGDDVAGGDLLLLHGLDHPRAEVVDGLHLRRAERHPPRLLAAGLPGGGLVRLDLHDLALDDVRLLHDPHADRPAERLRQRLRLRHLQREDLAAGHGREGRVLAQGLRQTHGDGRLARARAAREEDRAAGDLALVDHLVHDARRLPRAVLPDHALAHLARLEAVVEAQAADVAVGADALDARHLAHLAGRAGHGDVGHGLGRRTANGSRRRAAGGGGARAGRGGGAVRSRTRGRDERAATSAVAVKLVC